jgi:hypothetical protein
MFRNQFGLVEFPFTLFHGMKRNRRDEIPILFSQRGNSFAQKQISEKRLEPKLALVFEAMDDFEDDGFRDDRRARGGEMQFHFAAIRAFKSGRDVAFKRQTAAFAKRRADEAHLRPAFRADETALGRGAFGFANPADFGIKKSKAGIDRVLDC